MLLVLHVANPEVQEGHQQPESNSLIRPSQPPSLIITSTNHHRDSDVQEETASSHQQLRQWQRGNLVRLVWRTLRCRKGSAPPPAMMVFMSADRNRRICSSSFSKRSSRALAAGPYRNLCRRP